MKSNKSKKQSVQSEKISSLQQFKELYFPSLIEKEKSKDENNYGNDIAMSILEGINNDLKNEIWR